MGLKGYRTISPAQIDIRVVPFLFGKITNLITERLRIGEVFEREVSFNPRCIFVQLPAVNVTNRVFGGVQIESRHTALTGHTRFLERFVSSLMIVSPL